MIWQIKACTWQHQHKTLQAIRQQVFIEGQNISIEDEYDGLDEQAQHFLLFKNQQAVACARVIRKDDTIKIGRLAVLESHRRQGFASLLLEHINDQYPNTTQRLDAQCYLIHFYQTMGFMLCGRVFMDAGIAHLPMIKAR